MRILNMLLFLIRVLASDADEEIDHPDRDIAMTPDCHVAGDAYGYNKHL